MSSTHEITVVVSSYNQPNALRLVLSALSAQNDGHLSVVVADDGSDPDIAALVQEFARSVALPVQFITQERNGFRKARICNLAILATRAEQVLFCDGDTVPLSGHVAAHRRHFRPGAFCAGGRVRASAQESRALTPELVGNGGMDRLVTWRDRARLYGIHAQNVFYAVLGAKRKPKLFGGNFSAAREDLLAVDGLDEAYNNCSGVDSDLRNRLRNLGCRGESLWHKSVVCHLDHGLDPRRHTPDAVRQRRDPALYVGSRYRTRALRGISTLLRTPGS